MWGPLDVKKASKIAIGVNLALVIILIVSVITFVGDWIPRQASAQNDAGQQPSYVVYTDGTMTLAKDSSTGKTDFESSNSTSVIQQAIDGSSGEVLIENGQYLLDANLVLDDNSVLVGESTDAILMFNVSLSSGIMVSGSSNVTVSRLSIVMEYASPGFKTGAIDADGVSNLTVSDCHIIGGPNSISFVDGIDCIIRNNELRGAGSNAIYVINSSDIRIQSNHASELGTNGIVIEDTRMATISANVVEDWGRNNSYHFSSGIVTIATRGNASDDIITGNVLIGGQAASEYCGITIEAENIYTPYPLYIERVTISANTVSLTYGKASWGISVWGYVKTDDVAFRHNIQDCAVTGNSVTGASVGVYIQSSSHVAVDSNIVSSVMRQGVAIVVANNCSVTSNNIHDVGLAEVANYGSGVYLSGSHDTLVMGNIIKSGTDGKMTYAVQEFPYANPPHSNYSTDHNSIIYNHLESGSIGYVSTIGTNTIVKYNTE